MKVEIGRNVTHIVKIDLTEEIKKDLAYCPEDIRLKYLESFVTLKISEMISPLCVKIYKSNSTNLISRFDIERISIEIYKRIDIPRMISNKSILERILFNELHSLAIQISALTMEDYADYINSQISNIRYIIATSSAILNK